MTGRYVGDRVFRECDASSAHVRASTRGLGIFSVMPNTSVCSVYSMFSLHIVAIHPLTYHHQFVTALYDGHLRLFDYSQNLILDASLHQAPITSVCVAPFLSSDTESRILVSSSHDLTACLTHISLNSEIPTASTVASLHPHTSPLSSISTDVSGSHLLTSSWDGLIGVWDTSIPDDHQVNSERGDDRKSGVRLPPQT
jgi:WD40 repeat protein